MRGRDAGIAVALGVAAVMGCGGSGGGAGGSASTTSSETTTTTSGGGGGTGTTTSTGGGGTGPVGGPFTSKGGTSYEAQTSLAASSKGSVVAAWIGFFADSTSSIGYAISRDAGETWSAPQYIASPGGRLASNPVVAADGQGRFYLAWLGFRVASGPDEHVYLARLDTTATSFADPVIASDDGTSTTRDFDKPSLAIDANDNALLTWADFTSAATPALTFARTADGTTFTRSTIASGASFGNLAYLCVDASAGPTAPLYVVHLAVGATLALEKSVNQGMSFTQSLVPAANVVFQDPTCVARGSDLWVAYASGMAAPSPSTNAPGDAVFVARSTNGGGTFGAPVSVTGAAGSTLYLFPHLVGTSGGKLDLAYYQGTDGQPAALVRATSTDGAAWSTAKLADAGTFTLDRTLASWLGDYLGAGSAGAASFFSFTENTQNKAHIGFAKAAAP